RKRPYGLALGVVEAPLRADQQRGRPAPGREFRGSGGAALLVREEQISLGRPCLQQRFELHRFGKLRKRGAGTLLGRFGHDGTGAIGIELVGDATAREHRLDTTRPELGRLLENEVETILLEQRGTEPEVWHLLAF